MKTMKITSYNLSSGNKLNFTLADIEDTLIINDDTAIASVVTLGFTGGTTFLKGMYFDVIVEKLLYPHTLTIFGRLITHMEYQSHILIKYYHNGVSWSTFLFTDASDIIPDWSAVTDGFCLKKETSGVPILIFEADLVV